MPMIARGYANVEPIQLSAIASAVAVVLSVTSTTIPPVPCTGVIDRGLSTMEVILVEGTGSGTLNPVIRNYDNNGAYEHQINAYIEFIPIALDYNEINAHITDTTRDDHQQYLTIARHALIDHTMLGYVETFTTGTPASSHPGDVAQIGASGSIARGDHQHPRNPVSIDVPNVYVVGQVVYAPLMPTNTLYAGGSMLGVPSVGTWLQLGGQVLSQAIYPVLFAAIGNAYAPDLTTAGIWTLSGSIPPTYNPATQFALPNVVVNGGWPWLVLMG